jgi:hypothetical protein
MTALGASLTAAIALWVFCASRPEALPSLVTSPVLEKAFESIRSSGPQSVSQREIGGIGRLTRFQIAQQCRRSFPQEVKM